MLSPGDAFDRYTIEAFIGEGGMGRVYRALDTRLHRKVALKILGVEPGATAATHKVGLVHRDVKPENVMVRDDGVIKVLDFGVARRISEAVDAEGPTHMGNIPTLTGKGVVVGTPVYMAPEQMHGGPVDGRADQFGWGVMAFELLAGHRPWKEKADMLAMVASILTDPPQSLRDSAPEVPMMVERIILKVLR